MSAHHNSIVPNQVEGMDIHVSDSPVPIKNLQPIEPVEELPLRRSAR